MSNLRKIAASAGIRVFLKTRSIRSKWQPPRLPARSLDVGERRRMGSAAAVVLQEPPEQHRALNTAAFLGLINHPGSGAQPSVAFGVAT